MLKKLTLAFLAWVVCLWPAWFYLLVRFLAQPQGFWQEFALGSLAIVILGSIQIFFTFVAIMLTVVILNE